VCIRTRYVAGCIPASSGGGTLVAAQATAFRALRSDASSPLLLNTSALPRPKPLDRDADDGTVHGAGGAAGPERFLVPYA
jgi:hypothetical protein